MSKEWNESNEWGVSTGNYETQMEDVAPISSEIAVQQSEHVSTVEHYDWDQEKTEDTQEKKKDTTQKKRLRKILYGVASMAMVISMGQTLTNAKPVGILSEKEVKFDIGIRDADYAKNGVIALGGIDSVPGGGNVIFGFNHVDYNGDPIAVDTKHYGYYSKWVNSSGYMLARTYGNVDYTVFDQNGHKLCEWKNADYPGTHVERVAISDNNIVTFQRHVRNDKGYIRRTSYYTINGNELCSIDCEIYTRKNGMSFYSFPFRDKVALCNDNTGILLIRENGDKERLADWKVLNEESDIRKRFQVGGDGTIEGSDGQYILSNVPCIICGNISKGYFIVTDAVGNMAMVNVDTGKMYKVTWHYGTTDIDGSFSSKYIVYSDNEGSMMNLGTLMCSVEKNEDKELKSYLFDATRHCDEEGKRIDYLACYDAIYFEDYQYLVVRDGTEYCYIDLNGNRVSETFQKASTFNDFGYALVQTQSGAFYVIDSEFNKLEQVRGIDDFSIKDLGEVFWVTYKDEPHSYYYGPRLSDD